MKTRFFTVIISFIFLFTTFSNTIYAFTNENDDVTDNNIENPIENSLEKSIESIEKIDTKEIVESTFDENLGGFIFYKGLINIDSPTNSNIFIRPDEQKIDVNGWAVSTDQYASLKIYIDNNPVEANITRFSRPDVDKLISPDYGGVPKNINAGFSTSMDISALNAGIHILKIEENSFKGDLIASQEISFTIQNKKYNGTMYIDNPSTNMTLIRPDEEKVEINGWAVSEDENDTLRIFIDNVQVEANISRFNREDINKSVSPNYGGVQKTPKAGFNAIVDVSKYNVGKHTIKIEEYSRFGELITSRETSINVQNKKYKGTMYIDNPVQNKTFTRPDEEKININGWAVSEDEKATLKIYVDNVQVENNITRFNRDDINKSVSSNYGGTQKTPKAGFSSTIDVSKNNVGKHTIKIEEYSRFGELITSRETSINVQNKKYKGSMYIDNPVQNKTFTRPDEEKIAVNGWAVSEDEKATLKIYVDNVQVDSNITRFNRDDINKTVSSNYGGTQKTPKAGFSTTIDVGKYNAGKHNIKIEEYSRYGELITSRETSINVQNKKYKGTMYIDNPVQNKIFTRPDEENVSINGWAVSEDEKATLKIYVDNVQVDTNITRFNRDDINKAVSPNYGGTQKTPKAGFSTTINVGKYNAGKHIIKIEEYSRYGDLITSQSVQINVKNKQYAGVECIDVPGNNQTFIRQRTSQTSVAGWAVSEDQGAYLRILIDGNIISTNLKRTKRADVDKAVSPNYGGINITPNSGFEYLLNLSNLSIGEHTIRIEQLSRYGDLISAQDRRIKIENEKFLGEMCIDKPTYNYSYKSTENISVDGWAVSEDENAIVEIYIDGNYISNATRYYRPDVVPYSNKYGGKTLNAGFGKLISASSLSNGIHKITVYEKSRYGDIIGGVETQFMVYTEKKQEEKEDKKDEIPQIKSNGTKGIDVSQHQGNIDWAKVAKSDVKFSMIRIGYRGYGNGKLAEDTKFETNFKNSVKNGIKTGIYFYSTSLNADEAKKDVEYIIKLLDKYNLRDKVSMPIAIDLEIAEVSNPRDLHLSKEARTTVANTFCSCVESYGYTPMIYASKAFLNDNMNINKISYDIWVAQYNTKCTYKGNYTMWQNSSKGSISGIKENVDTDYCYKNY